MRMFKFVKLQIVELYVKSITERNLVERVSFFLWAESIPYFAILIFQNESIPIDMHPIHWYRQPVNIVSCEME